MAADMVRCSECDLRVEECKCGQRCKQCGAWGTHKHCPGMHTAQEQLKETGAAKVEEMGPHAYMSVDEMLAYAVRDHGMADAMLIGYDKRNGALIVLSSKLTRAEANFMVDRVKLTILDIEPD